MQKHIRNYVKFFDIGEDEPIQDELNCDQAVDPHHIIRRSQGGSDYVENIIALSRENHDRAHGIIQPRINKTDLLKQHIYNIITWIVIKKNLGGEVVLDYLGSDFRGILGDVSKLDSSEQTADRVFSQYLEVLRQSNASHCFQ